MKIEPIFQIKSLTKESWVDVPENLYKSGLPFRDKRIIYSKEDIVGLQQEAIANYYNSGQTEFYRGQIEILNQLLTK